VEEDAVMWFACKWGFISECLRVLAEADLTEETTCMI